MFKRGKLEKLIALALFVLTVSPLLFVNVPLAYAWSLSDNFGDGNVWTLVRYTNLGRPLANYNITANEFSFWPGDNSHAWSGAYLWTNAPYTLAGSTLQVNITVPDANEQYNAAFGFLAVVKDSSVNATGVAEEPKTHDGYRIEFAHPRTGASGASTTLYFIKRVGSTDYNIANVTLGAVYTRWVRFSATSTTIYAEYSVDSSAWNLIGSTSLDSNIPGDLYIMLGGYSETSSTYKMYINSFTGGTSGETFDFAVSVNPSSGSVQQGSSVTTTVTVAFVSGTTQTVSLTVSGLPSGATATFTPSSGNPTYQSSLNITTSTSTPTGTYTIIITGTCGGLTRTAAYTLIVTSVPPGGNTLIQRVESLINTVNWAGSIYTVYLGYMLGTKTLSEFKNAWLALTDAREVLYWASVLMKLGIEDEAKIKWALDAVPMLPNGLPDNAGENTFHVSHRGVLYAGLYYAKKYNYQTSKWNVNTAYNSFKYAVQHGMVPGAGVLWVYGDGTSFTIGYGPRHYDEAAQSLDVFLMFYDLGVSAAMDDAVSIWNWIVANLWTGTYFKYALNWDCLECAVGGFYQIIAKLWQRNPNIQNIQLLSKDISYRFLANRWNSPQWGGETSYFAVLHAYPSNTQRRLENTIMAWSSLMGIYNRMNATEQSWIIDLLQGYGSYPNPAWVNLLQGSGLYDSTSNQFTWWTDTSVSNDATAAGTALIFMQGMIPQDGSLAVPLEENGYEYTLNMLDPQLFQLNIAARTVTLSVFMPGTIKFVYGSTTAAWTFTKTGVWQVTFSSDWNSITSATFISELPSNRRYLGEVPISHIFKVSIYSSPMGITVNVNGTEYATPYEKSWVNGTLLYLEFPASWGNWTWNYWSDGSADRVKQLTVTRDITLVGYYKGVEGAVIQPPPVIIVTPTPPAQAVDLDSLPALVAAAFGAPLIFGQLLLGVVFLLAVLLPVAVVSRGNADEKVYLLLGLPTLGILTAIGWFPVWIMLIIVLITAALWSGKVREWLSG